MDGVTVAFSAFAIAAGISMLTAALMAIIVKIIAVANRRNSTK